MYALILWRSGLGLLTGKVDFHQMVCALILWRSALGLLIGKFRQFLTELSAQDTSVFSFLDDNFLLNIDGFSPNLVCALILWTSALGIANGRISSIFDSYLPTTQPCFTFRAITWLNISRFSPDLMFALILWRSALELLIGKVCQFLGQSYLPTKR